ncbi:MAG: tRNA lysidine(34) synthetase TilS [Ferruginibacter sp.]
MNLLEKFKAYIKQHNLFQPKDKLLLAVSGGVDSVVLCELCKQAGYDFAIAHCNFQLRGEESNRDEEFVITLAKNYGVEVLAKKFDTEKYAAENKLSIQVAARELRYKWFDELLNKMKSDLHAEVANCQPPTAYWLLTAHHANDNIETLLMNFFKGTGIGGLHGILPKQGNLMRPLLFAKKEELTAFALANNLRFVEDASNASDKYTRNYFRNQLIPGLQKVFPQVEENLLQNIDRFREIAQLYQQAVNETKKKLLEFKGNEIHIPVLKLLKTKALKTILFEVIKDFGYTAQQTDEVVGLLQSETGKYVQSATHRIIKNRNWLIIAPNENTEAGIFLLEKEGHLEFAEGRLHLKKIVNIQSPILHNPLAAQLNAAEIKYPLILRKWKPGDYFYPLGMAKKKKLNRFLSDLKFSVTQKEKTWVIEMDKKIVWVVGLRIDDRFKITDNTKDILQISLTVAK